MEESKAIIKRSSLIEKLTSEIIVTDIKIERLSNLAVALLVEHEDYELRIIVEDRCAALKAYNLLNSKHLIYLRERK